MPLLPLGRDLEKHLRLLQTRQGRRKSEYFICEGLRCCAEALARRPQWACAAVFDPGFADEDTRRLVERARIPAHLASPEQFAHCAQTEHPQGILLLLRRPSWTDTPPRDPFLLVLDRLINPGNLGTILRTAWAAGLTRVVCTQGCADPYGAKAVRSGMGAQFDLELVATPDLATAWADARAHGYDRLWLAAPRAAVSCFDAGFELQRGVLVLGNETAGPGDVAGASAVRIPMPGGAESLNVAQAAAILIFQAVARGLLGGPDGRGAGAAGAAR